MNSTEAIFNLPIPTGKTVLMQHLQTLVLRGNRWWIGGIIPFHKFEHFAIKMAGRYPLLRNERGRSYDRSKHLASVHFVAFPTKHGIAWWILSSDGAGGLVDGKSLDLHVAKDAFKSDGHITFDDYVLLYAHKKDARTITDAKTGREKRIIKDSSTWTWKISKRAYAEVVASIDRAVYELDYGDDCIADHMYGLRGILAFQRRRPLFSGVRTQVLEFHRVAGDLWPRVHKTWLERHKTLAAKAGEGAGKLRSLNEITSTHLPKMQRFKVFGEVTLQDLLRLR